MDETENVLHQMRLFSGEDFSVAQLNASSNAEEYTDTFRMPALSSMSFPLAHLSLLPWPGDIKLHPVRCIERYMSECGVLKSDKDIADAAEFIRRCIRLNPQDRPSAEELLQDPWFDGVE